MFILIQTDFKVVLNTQDHSRSRFSPGFSVEPRLAMLSVLPQNALLYRNFDAMSFLDLLLNYKDLQMKGYNKTYLDQNLNSLLSLPFFLFLMTGLAAILTMNTLKKSNNLTFVIVGLITCVAVYYFKDLSLALGQANRIPLSLAAWVPVVAIGLFTSIGVLQINEK